MPEISIYQTESGVVEVRLDQDTVWVSQEQMSALFGVQKAAISKHLKNIFISGELERTTTVSKMETVQREGERSVKRRIEYFNLDAVISVGYRVNSLRATHFRQWATRTLREHLTQGYTLNRQRLEANARELEAALLLVRRAVHSPNLQIDAGRGLIEIITRYAQTFLLLQRYDEGLLTEPVQLPGGALPTLDTARALVAGLKADLMARGEATSLFAQERGDAFADGNKRCGAFLFVEFLSRNGRLLGADGAPVLNDIGLAALALLVAESAPAQKETIIRLIMNMLSTDDAL